MGDARSLPIVIEADAEAFDDWVRSVRVMVSQIGFALDGYLASRPEDSEVAS